MIAAIALISIAWAMPPADLVERYECARCHDGVGAAVPRAKHCVRCHQDILSDRFEASSDVLARWKGNLHSLVVVPSLAGSEALLRRAWVEAFLRDPHDVRPHLDAMMPRLEISADDARRLAARLVPREAAGAGPSPAGVERGRQLFRSLACGTCHAYSGAGDVGGPPARPASGRPSPAVVLAPDLRFSRRRLQPAAVADWLRDPAGLRPGTMMPTFDLTEEAAEALAAFVLYAPLEPATRPSGRLAPEPSLGKVSFDDVSRRVFRKVCWHCHSSPDFARGDGGPGNTGGFGFAPRGLDLSSYAGVSAGMIGADGERTSVFAQGPDGVPHIVRALRARVAEVQGAPVPGIRGMPLGLPPLPERDIRLVEAWIAQGRPR